MGQKQRQMHGRKGGPGMGGPADRSKDFKGAWMNLLRYCKKEWPVIGFALGCAMVGTILTLIGPDRLSDLTDLIQDGIMTRIDLHAIAKSAFCWQFCMQSVPFCPRYKAGLWQRLRRKSAKICAVIFPERSIGCRCGTIIRLQPVMCFPV